MSDELSDVWGLYAEEGGRSLDEVEECLLILRDAPSNTDAVARLFRSLHTYKGNARILGLSVIESVAHLAEDMVGLVRDEGMALDDEIVGLLLEATDTLRGMLEVSVTTHQDADGAQADDLSVRMRDKFAACRTEMSGAEDGAVMPVAEVPPAAGEEARAAPAAPPEPAAAVQKSVQSIVFEPLAKDSLANDPVYREIFTGMAHDVLREMQSALDGDGDAAALRAKFAEEGERLRHAAEQIGMLEWLLVLQDFLGIAHPARGQCEALVSRLQGLYDRESHVSSVAASGAGQASDDPVRRFFDALERPLGRLSQLGNHLSDGKEVSLDEVAAAAGQVRALAEEHGFVRVMAVLDRVIADARAGQGPLDEHFARLEFLLYEELVSVADVMLEDRAGQAVDPRSILQSWCADHVFESLLDMRNVLERIKRGEDVSAQCARMNELMRHVYHAAMFYSMETAAHLSMSMVDLFARVEMGEMAADAVLLHIAKAFIGDMEIILDAAGLGEAPDMAQVEKLLQAASEATFAASGTVSSSQIEARLGLPKSFHKVLTPDNVKTALQGLENRHHFYIVRSDLNNDEELAGNFLGWMNSGAAQVISNVTIFEDGRSLFDFLISSPLDALAFTEALTVLDPQGRCLNVEMALEDRKAGDAVGVNAGGQEAAAEEDLARAMTVQQGTMSGDMLESIGELVTGQAMVHHLLTGLFESDLVRSVEADVAVAGGDWPAARGAVRQTLENWQEKLEKLIQLESHNSALLNRLQEEAIAVRVRPASVLLRPLVPFVEGVARQHARQVSLVTDGDDTGLDFSMLDRLKSALRAILTFCVTQSIEPPERRIGADNKAGRGLIRVSLVKHEDHVSITVEDDGMGIDLDRVAQRARQLGWHDEHVTAALVLREGYGEAANSDPAGVDLAAIRAQMRNSGGDLHVGNRPGGGTHFALSMPLAMVVLEGMVVRVGEVQYVVPIDAIQRIVRSGAEELMQVSADSGRYVLRLESDDVLPIQFLRRGGGNGQDGNVVTLAALNQGAPEDGDALKHLFMLVGKNGQRTAISVDELIGQQQVLIRPLQGYLSGIRGVTGCALLGSGDVGMVLDMGYVLSQEMGVGR